MKPEILKPFIRCDTCHLMLETGDPGGKTIERRCHSCVMKTTSGSNNNEILMPDGTKIPKDSGQSFEQQVTNMTNRVNSQTSKPDRFVFEYKWVDADDKNPQGRLLLLIRYETYEKKLIAELGLPTSQLEEFISEMKDHESEIEMDIAKQKIKEEP